MSPEQQNKEQMLVGLINQPKMVNSLDGYKKLDRALLPQKGIFYPEGWEFAYRCPTAKEVANFSTLNEQDKPAIMSAIEDLIRKCVVIYDTELESQVSAGQILDSHRVFFILLLREFYLPGSPISYIGGMCSHDKEILTTTLSYGNLIYPEATEKLLAAFDGRLFSLNINDNIIKFLAPTINLTSKIFKHIVKIFKASQNDANNQKQDDLDKLVYDKNFLLIAPYLFEYETDTMRDISKKFEKIQTNSELFKAYLEIATKIKLDNFDYVETNCPVCGSSEETQIRFPGGWKTMFISNKDTSGYF